MSDADASALIRAVDETYQAHIAAVIALAETRREARGAVIEALGAEQSRPAHATKDGADVVIYLRSTESGWAFAVDYKFPDGGFYDGKRGTIINAMAAVSVAVEDRVHREEA